MPKLILKRSRELVNMSSEYIIYVDGKKKARLANGKKVELKIKPGNHLIEAKVDNYHSEPITLELEKGAQKELKIRSFKFNSWILPSIMVLVPLYYYLRTEFDIPSFYGFVVIGPIALYALYYHTIGRNKYLRLIP